MKLKLTLILLASFLLILPLVSGAPSWLNQGENSSIGWINGAIGLSVKIIPEDDYWNLSEAGYTGTSLSTQDISPTGLFWKPDGTKLYEVGDDGDSFYRYSCTTAWDLSSCSYDGNSLSTLSQDPAVIFWKSDGIKLYGVDRNGAPSTFHGYNCSDAWNLSSCSSLNSLSAQDLYPTGMSWNGSGTKLYEVGYGNNLFYSYDCSDAWNLSSCSYTGANLSTQGHIEGMFWKSDGTRLYGIEDSNNLIHEYSCGAAWDLSTCSYTGTSLSTQDGSPMGLFWKSDGNKLYEVGSGSDLFYSYNVGIPLDTATLATNASGSYSNVSTKDLGGATSETWSNFTYSLPSDCDKLVGWKQYVNDTNGGTNLTDVMTFKLGPFFETTSNSTVLNSIKTCGSNHNVTLQAQADGDAIVTIRMKKFARNGFNECNYGSSLSDKIKTNNLTNYCNTTLTYSSLSTGDSDRVVESEAVSGKQPSNLPAAIAGGIIGTLTVLYAIKRWKS